jgi:competence protein ComEC
MSIVFYKKHPFIRFLLPLIAGIVFRYYINASFQTSLTILAVMGIAFYAFHPFQLNYKWGYLKGIVLTGFIASLGLFIANNQLSDQIENTPLSKDVVWFAGKLNSVPLEKEKSIKANIMVQAQLVGSEWKDQDAQLLALFEKDSVSLQLIAGQQILFKAQINKKIQGTNPFGFDYQKYLKLKQIESTIFLKSNDWRVIDSHPKGIFAKALNIRNYLISIFEEAGIQGDELTVLSALTLGYQDKMDARIRNSYAGAGAVHILSVSGSHVAIIFVMLSFMLKGLPFANKNPRFKYLLIIAALWIYALITGLSPSVCRATTMFTFVLVGNLLKKPINIYNSIAASAAFLLLINPLWLFDIGFQLSYISVLGIVYLYPKIYGLWYVKNTIIDFVWSLTAVSIAAQLVTTPLSLYYFHVFPTYFWLSNIGVVLGATVLIHVAVLLLIVSKIPLMVSILGAILKFMLVCINSYVEWITTLPLAQLTNISMNGFAMVMLYCLLISMVAWMLTKNYHLIMTALSILLLLTIVRVSLLIKQRANKFICVYQIPNQTAIQFLAGHNSWWYISQLPPDTKTQRIISDANTYWGTTHNQYFQTDSLSKPLNQNAFFMESGFWKLGNCQGMLVKNDIKPFLQVNDSLKLDLLLVTGKPKHGIKELPSKLIFSQVVIDGSVPIWKTNQWVPDGLLDSVFLTPEMGAFILPIP